jgi:hypothetical protein
VGLPQAQSRLYGGMVVEMNAGIYMIPVVVKLEEQPAYCLLCKVHKPNVLFIRSNHCVGQVGCQECATESDLTKAFTRLIRGQ